jgi:hypothetical protein
MIGVRLRTGVPQHAQQPCIDASVHRRDIWRPAPGWFITQEIYEGIDRRDVLRHDVANCMDLNTGHAYLRGTCPRLQIRSANGRHDASLPALRAVLCNLSKLRVSHPAHKAGIATR